jgi:integration host factor subunit alpha
VLDLCLNGISNDKTCSKLSDAPDAPAAAVSKRQGRNNRMSNMQTVEFESVLDADLNRAMREAQARSQAEKNLPTLTKAELAELLFEQVGLNKREAKDMVETFFDEIRDALERGESVKLSGFGNFQLRDKPQRPGRNPKTGEEIPITARRVVTFHASQKLKGMVEVASLQPIQQFAAVPQINS